MENLNNEIELNLDKLAQICRNITECMEYINSLGAANLYDTTQINTNDSNVILVGKITQFFWYKAWCFIILKSGNSCFIFEIQQVEYFNYNKAKQLIDNWISNSAAKYFIFYNPINFDIFGFDHYVAYQIGLNNKKYAHYLGKKKSLKITYQEKVELLFQQSDYYPVFKILECFFNFENINFSIVTMLYGINSINDKRHLFHTNALLINNIKIAEIQKNPEQIFLKVQELVDQINKFIEETKLLENGEAYNWPNIYKENKLYSTVSYEFDSFICDHPFPSFYLNLDTELILGSFIVKDKNLNRVGIALRLDNPGIHVTINECLGKLLPIDLTGVHHVKNFLNNNKWTEIFDDFESFVKHAFVSKDHLVNDQCDLNEMLSFGSILLAPLTELYYHAGVYLGNDKIIHVKTDNMNSFGQIFKITKLSEFITDNTCIKELKCKIRFYSDSELYERVNLFSKVEYEYNAYENNCEYLAFELLTGEKGNPDLEIFK